MHTANSFVHLQRPFLKQAWFNKMASIALSTLLVLAVNVLS